AELSEAGEPASLGIPYDFVSADFDPGMRRKPTAFPGHAKAQSARYATPVQHDMGRQRTRQTASIHPGLCADVFDGPEYPVGFIGCETIDAAKWPVGPLEDA